MSISVFVAVRVLHILVAALWVGAGVFFAAFLMPALRRLGTGDTVLAGLLHGRMDKFMAFIAGLTVLSGLWLYWELTHGLDAGITLSPVGIVFGLGGLIGLAAAIVGGAVIGRSVKQVASLTEQAATLADGTERAAHAQAMVRAQQRAATAAKCDAVLLIVALVLMALGHYV